MLKRNAKTAALLVAAALFLPQMPASGAAAVSQETISSGTTSIVLYINKKDAFLNGKQVALDIAPVITKGKTFVPAEFLGRAFDMNVEWDNKTKTLTMTNDKIRIKLDTKNKSAFVNDYWFKLTDVATVVGGKPLIKLTWLSSYLGATYTFNSQLQRIDVLHLPKPTGAYDPKSDSSKPVAKFTFAKSSYRIGEPVDYVNLSYDPDAEGLTFKWEGKEEAYFKAGTYPITLTAVDKSGNKSAPYTRNLVITDETYLNKNEYPIYRKPAGSFISTDWSTLYGNYLNLDKVAKTVSEDRSRSLLVSDSPETFDTLGILYQDTVEGKTRLYANHQNGMSTKAAFAILATNTTDHPVTLKTTRKGEVYPTIYAMLMGSEASVDFLVDDAIDEEMTIPPGETYVYKQFPDFYPGQGVNLLYDVESDGRLQYTFAVADQVSTAMLDLPKLPYNQHIRGTFPVTGFDWSLDLSEASLTKPKMLAIGDGKDDPFQQGYDPLRAMAVTDPANFGAVYHIHADHPRKMAILLLAKGGYYKGPFKIDGSIRRVPDSGVLTAFDGMIILKKTTGNEDSLDIEFTPPAGSSFPINLIFYPLDERAN